jgi:hypothetical protein
MSPRILIAFLTVTDRSSPIVIPDDEDDDGESSTSYGGTRPEKPDYIKNIDPI